MSAAACSVPPERPLLVSGHIASTLGESLNCLIIVLALALRLNASAGLPWIPGHQLHVPNGAAWWKDMNADGIDLCDIINTTSLALVLHIGPGERCLAEGQGSRVAVQLHRNGAHYMWSEHFSLDSSNVLHAAAIGGQIGTTSKRLLNLPELRNSRSFDEMIEVIHSLQRQHRGSAPLAVFARMDAYPELSCGFWGLAPEMLRLLPHLDFVRPRSPGVQWEAMLDEELALTQQCGYAFFRGSATLKLKPTMASADTMQLSAALPNDTSFQQFKFFLTGHISTEKVAQRLVYALQKVESDCIYLDMAGKGNITAPLAEALSRHGVRVVEWHVPSKYKPVPSPRWLRPPMQENLLKLFYARHARLFFAERGSCWSDLVSMIRTDRQLPTMIMRASNRSLQLEEAEHCVRVRGACVRPMAPYPYYSGRC